MTRPEEQSEEQQEVNFEAAFTRLEQILTAMNSASVTLDDSLTLFEEADRLLTLCSEKLTKAEQRIEVLVKNRSGGLVLGTDNRPVLEKNGGVR